MDDCMINIRKLEKDDVSSVIELLQSLSSYKPSSKSYSKICSIFFNQKNVFSLVAVVNKEVVSYGSIIIETKIRGGKKGHMEDVVTHVNFRKKKIGTKIINNLFEIAKKEGCYKVSLECNKYNIPFYKNCKFEISGIGMQRFL